MTSAEPVIQVRPDAPRAAAFAAREIAAEARLATTARGRFCLAVSGGRTPWMMLRKLAELPNIDWPRVHLFQVDERLVPADDPQRNFTHLREVLLSRVPIPAEQVHAMPVEQADLETAVTAYTQSLIRSCGDPPVLDLVHLGLGSDGHTASLVPGDAVLRVDDREVALTAPYQGRRRMTLTFPALNRARRVIWLVTGADKAEALRRLRAADPAIPAVRVQRACALLICDTAAAGELGQ